MDDLNIAFVSTTFGNSGIGTYSRELYQALQEQGYNVTKVHIDSKNSKINIGEGDHGRSIQKLKIPFEPGPLFNYRCQYDIPDGFDIYHLAHPGISFLNVEPKIVTCHDLIKYKSPRAYTEYITRRGMYKPLTSADQIIAISDSTKQDLVEILSITADDVSIVHNGVSKRYSPHQVEKRKLLESHDLSTDCEYILYVGSEEPRKNIARLLRAFKLICEKRNKVRLIKIGGASKFGSREETVRQLRELEICDRVHFLNNIPESQMPEFYNLADVFVFPSLYEGFGLPAIEALACGTPTVVSNIASLPEIVGDAAIKCDPHSTTDIAEAVMRVLTNSKLQEELRKRGPVRASQFTWERTAKLTANAYKKTLYD